MVAIVGGREPYKLTIEQLSFSFYGVHNLVCLQKGPCGYSLRKLSPERQVVVLARVLTGGDPLPVVMMAGQK